MIDVNFIFEFSRRSTISDLTDQNYSDEFSPGVASLPSPPLVQNRLGAIGEERPVPPTLAPRSTPEPYGASAGFNVVGGAAINIHNLRQREHHHQNHHHQQQPPQQQQHQQRPPNANGRAARVEQAHHARHHPDRNANRQPLHRQGRVAHEPRVERPACCCFCYGTAKVE
ncbi:hypothetical protein CAEBREN_02654 [Caenorhabditis brenneri]|uniref:Uncharacterized protein n=1 Tax=Caenorhabditis brenneri TaxID=135651 RepID=G0MQ24_CAEBE|nr:hypothetical protein CAEBREN_02654 [Caenorhabditis brenneri]